MNTKPSIIIVGCGDIGTRVANLLLQQHWTVYGLRQRIEQLPSGVLPIQADLSSSERPTQWPIQPIDYVLYSAAAKNSTEQGYQTVYVDGLSHVLSWLKDSEQQPKRLLFTSSTGVYGQHQHEWIDEQSETQPERWTGQIMLQAEQLLKNSYYPATCVRLAGIYGPGRNRLIQQVKQGVTAVEQDVFTNRIHAYDAAALITDIMLQHEQGKTIAGCYIGVDNEPALLKDVIEWLRAQLQVTTTSPDLVMRRSSSKRCSNTLAKSLGWQPLYPSFREGYAALIEQCS